MHQYEQFPLRDPNNTPAITPPPLGSTNLKSKEECDLDQRLVSSFVQPLDPPLGVSAASLPLHADLTHPCDSL